MQRVYQILKISFLVCIISFVTSLTGCVKFISSRRAPVTSISQENVFATDASAISVLTGVYQQINQENLFSGDKSVSLMAGLSADEFTLSTAVPSSDTKYFFYIDSFYTNINSSQGTLYWSPFYNYIFRCNNAIEGLGKSDGLSPNIKTQLLGEAKFLRAFFYFYLLNLYGEIPLIVNADWQTNQRLPTSSRVEVYNQIVDDLVEAKILLSEKYLDGALQEYKGTPERVRPTKWSAIALLARVYLYKEDWVNAEIESTILIENSSQHSLAKLNSTFLKNSTEAIWQLQPVQSGRNTSDGVLFLLPTTGPSSTNPVYLSQQILMNFEIGDQRRYNRNWIDSVKVGSSVYFFPYKYKAGVNSTVTSASQLTEYLMILRLGEQFLIRSEARAQQNNLSGAINDLNVIRFRAGLSNLTSLDQSSLLKSILHERQVELFSEWGNRWLDIKRTKNVDAIMSLVRPLKAKGAQWQSFRQLYPIPYDDIQKNMAIKQNPGYE